MPHPIRLLFLLLGLTPAGSLVAAATEADPPAASIDLTTAEGAALVQGSWRYRDVDFVRVPFRGAGADGQPTGTPGSTWDIQPHAGARDFDDHDWPVIDATTLAKHRGPGRMSFAWYRIQVTVPARVGEFDTRGSSIDVRDLDR